MTTQRDRAETFRALHLKGRPLVLFNAWNVGSAGAIERAGASAIATSSWAVAVANGHPDGERLPLSLALDNLAHIVASTSLPVSIDLEAGYGEDAAQVSTSVQASARVGAVGCNLEDSVPNTGQLREVADQVERIRCARQAVDRVTPCYFINARSDVFFQHPHHAHDETLLAAAIDRARAYAAAGADGFFAPGLSALALIERLVAASPIPVNIMVDDQTPNPATLADLGVARVSYGPRPYLLAMKAVEAAARIAFERSDRGAS